MDRARAVRDYELDGLRPSPELARGKGVAPVAAAVAAVTEHQREAVAAHPFGKEIKTVANPAPSGPGLNGDDCALAD
jgi:hypothetical protein